MNGTCTDIGQDAGGGDAEQPSSSSHEDTSVDMMPHERLRTDQHSRPDDQSEELAARDLRWVTDDHVEDENDDMAPVQLSHDPQAALPTRATRPQSLERETSELQAYSAERGQIVQRGRADVGVVADLVRQAAALAHRRENDRRSADGSRIGTSTTSDTPEPTGRRQFTVDELRNLQGLPMIGDSTAGASSTSYTTGNMAKDSATSERSSVLRNTEIILDGLDRGWEGTETQTLPDTQATPLQVAKVQLSGLRKHTGVQSMSADADRQLFQDDGNNKATDNSATLLEQTVPSHQEDGEAGVGGGSSEAVAHISESQEGSTGESSFNQWSSNPKDYLGG